MTGTDITELLGILVLISLTGFFAMSETAITRTGRARAYRLVEEKRRGGGPEIRVVASPDKDYDPDQWWKSRQGQKTAFLEWVKTLTSYFGI